MRDFAVLTGHLTPRMLARECEDLPDGVPVYATHLKPGFEEEIEELVFEVEDSCSMIDLTDGTSELRLRPVEEICNHIWQLRAKAQFAGPIG